MEYCYLCKTTLLEAWDGREGHFVVIGICVLRVQRAVGGFLHVVVVVRVDLVEVQAIGIYQLVNSFYDPHITLAVVIKN